MARLPAATETTRGFDWFLAMAGVAVGLRLDAIVVPKWTAARVRKARLPAR